MSNYPFSSIDQKINIDQYYRYEIPTPQILPCENLESKSQDSGIVMFEYGNSTQLRRHAELNGKVNLNSAFGITDQHLYAACRKSLCEAYCTDDIQLGEYHHEVTQNNYVISVPYTVSGLNL